MDEQEIRQIIQSAHTGGQDADVRAETYLRSWQTASRPVLLACNDGQDYVVKGRQNGRMIVNDRVVGLLGDLIDAPVPGVALVDLPGALITAERALAHMPQGLSHGSLLVRNSSEREALLHTNEPQNRCRFARLAVLYGWVQAGDHQFIYENAPPHQVHSVDHGHFFPGGPNWTESSLQAAPAPQLDSHLESACRFSSDEIREAVDCLQAIEDETIVRAVARVPVDWGLTMQETVIVSKYLCERREQLCRLLMS